MTEIDSIHLYEHLWSAMARGGFVKITLPNATVVAQIAEISSAASFQNRIIKLAPTDVYGLPTPVQSFKLSDVLDITPTVMLDVKMK